MNRYSSDRLDLAWARQKIPGFEKLVRQAQMTKDSENEYKEKYAEALRAQRDGDQSLA